MIVKVSEKNNKKEFCIGDIVQIGGSFYLAHNVNGAYMLVCLTGSGGAVGTHRSLLELNMACERYNDIKVYSRTEYYLNLIEKESN